MAKKTKPRFSPVYWDQSTPYRNKLSHLNEILFTKSIDDLYLNNVIDLLEPVWADLQSSFIFEIKDLSKTLKKILVKKSVLGKRPEPNARVKAYLAGYESARALIADAIWHLIDNTKDDLLRHFLKMEQRGFLPDKKSQDSIILTCSKISSCFVNGRSQPIDEIVAQASLRENLEKFISEGLFDEDVEFSSSEFRKTEELVADAFVLFLHKFKAVTHGVKQCAYCKKYLGYEMPRHAKFCSSVCRSNSHNNKTREKKRPTT
jgi:hypothetical protein